MNIEITTIPHSEQDYPTVGDWEFLMQTYYPTGDDPEAAMEDTLGIWVSELGDWKMEALVALHELVEALLCKAAGISGEKVTAFDKAFEERRSRGEVPADAEPGDDPVAPYHIQHGIAATTEHFFAVALGVDWNEYDRKVKAL